MTPVKEIMEFASEYGAACVALRVTEAVIYFHPHTPSVMLHDVLRYKICGLPVREENRYGENTKDTDEMIKVLLRAYGSNLEWIELNRGVCRNDVA